VIAVIKVGVANGLSGWLWVGIGAECSARCVFFLLYSCECVTGLTDACCSLVQILAGVLGFKIRDSSIERAIML